MSNTINIGGIEVSKFYLGGSSDVKIYLGTTKLYPHLQEPCFAVVADISQYSDRTYVDVYNQADDKWYKLNNLNQYEEYGIYGSGRTITTYDGKLTVDEVTIPSPSRLPSGYTEVEYIRNSNYNAYINTGVIPYDNTSNRFTVTARVSSEYHSNLACATIIACEEVNSPYYGFGYRYKCSAQQDVLEFFGADGTVSKTSASTSGDTVTLTFNKTANSTKTINVPLYIFGACENSSYTSATRYSDSALYSMTVVKNNETVRDFVPAKRDSDDKYGLYDLITDTFYTSPNGNNFSGGSEVIPPSTTATCEFMYSGDSWVNVGEVSGSSRLPNGYTEIEYVENNSLALIDTGFKPNQDTRILAEMQVTTSTSYNPHFGCGGWNTYNSIRMGYETRISGTLHVKYGTNNGWTVYNNIRGDYNKHTYDWNKNQFYRDGTLIGSVTYGNFQTTDNLGIFFVIENSTIAPTSQYICYGRVYSFKIYDDDVLARDLVPCTRDNDSRVGMYDITNDVFYYPPNYESYQLLAGPTVTGGTVYPMYYDEKSDPPNNLTFSSMTEAEAYECPWVGMKATIDGDNYVFSGDSQSGYEWVYQEVLPYIELQYIEMPQTSPYCAVQLADSYSASTNLYYDFTIMLHAISDTRIIGFNTNSYLIGYNGSTIYLNISGSRTFTINNFATDTVYHFGLGYKNGSYVFENIDTSSTYASFNRALPKTEKPYFGAIKLNGTVYVNGDSERIYAIKVYNGDTLVGDYIPVKRRSDGFVTLYDKVSAQFCDTVGDGTMVAGNPINS